VFELGWLLLFVTTLAFRFSLRLLILLLFVFEALMLAQAIMTTTKPIPITAKAARPPRTHQIAFDFF